MIFRAAADDIVFSPPFRAIFHDAARVRRSPLDFRECATRPASASFTMPPAMPPKIEMVNVAAPKMGAAATTDNSTAEAGIIAPLKQKGSDMQQHTTRDAMLYYSRSSVQERISSLHTVPVCPLFSSAKVFCSSSSPIRLIYTDFITHEPPAHRQP